MHALLLLTFGICMLAIGAGFGTGAVAPIVLGIVGLIIINLAIP